MPRNVALIPALNEEATIHRIVCDALLSVQQVLVVDDGSHDHTGTEATRAGAVVLRNEQTLGQGGSLRRGLSWLFDRGVQNAIILDGDGAHNPRYIANLLRVHSRAHADLTVGSRFLPRYCALPTPKRSANKFATGLLNNAFHLNVTDAASGMRVISCRVANLPFTREDFAFAFEMLRLCRVHGLTIAEAPIEARYDALELFCTNRAELMNLVDYCATAQGTPPIAVAQCLEAMDHIRSWKAFCAEVAGELFVFHPLRSHGGYVIQEQHPDFQVPGAPASITFPVAISL